MAGGKNRTLVSVPDDVLEMMREQIARLIVQIGHGRAPDVRDQMERAARQEGVLEISYGAFLRYVLAARQKHSEIKKRSAARRKGKPP